MVVRDPGATEGRAHFHIADLFALSGPNINIDFVEMKSIRLLMLDIGDRDRRYEMGAR